MSRSERDATSRGREARQSGSRREWEGATLAPSQDRRPERAERFSTVSDLPIERLYTRENLGPDWNESEKLGFPGEYPYHGTSVHSDVDDDEGSRKTESLKI